MAGKEVEAMAGKDSEAMATMDSVESMAAVPNPMDELETLANEFQAKYDSREGEVKMHRFPARLRASLGDQYVVPLVVAIGPYHHGLPRLQEMETVKRVAAYHLIANSDGSSYEDIYREFKMEVHWVFMLMPIYENVGPGMNNEDFASMMLLDACFLLQYMVAMNENDQHGLTTEMGLGQALSRFLLSNRASIDNDIMLLENQIPWHVVKLLSTFLPECLQAVEKFVERLACTFQINHGVGPTKIVSPSSSPSLKYIMASYQPPHLLALFRLYKIGTSKLKEDPVHDELKHEAAVSVPVSATELAGVAIKLTPSDSPDLAYVGIRRGRLLFDDFFLAPLYLDSLSACWLVNMAALELCMGISTGDSDTAHPVCSYLALLAMLMSREEDVHCARAKRFLQGQLTDKQMLSFFSTITQHISPGPGYFQILADIEACKRRRWVRIAVQTFVTDNAKAIAAVLSLIGVLVGIFKALYSVKQPTSGN